MASFLSGLQCQWQFRGRREEYRIGIFAAARGMSARTQQMYVRAVRQLAQHYGKPPDQINNEELRQYLLCVKNVKHWSRSGTTIALCGLKFFYEHTLRRPLTMLQMVRPAREKKLPVVLSREEVRRVLSQVRLLRYRTCLTTMELQRCCVSTGSARGSE